MNNALSLISPLTGALACGGNNLTGVGNVTLNSGKLLTMTAGSTYWAKGADIVSAATLPIGTDGNSFNVTGATGPVTSFSGMVAGMIFSLEFDSTPTLTYHATNLILPSSANIVAAAGDTSIWQAITTTTARCLVYQRRTGAALVAPAADSDATLTFTDITTNNSSTSNHGFLKKLDNSATNFMNGQGNWAAPAASAGTLTAGTTLDTVISFTANAVYTQAHGLGAVPAIVQVWLECVTAEKGYVAGDRVDGSRITVDSAGDGGTSGWVTQWDATNVVIVTGAFTNNPFIVNKTTPAGATFITLANWKIKAVPYKLN